MQLVGGRAFVSACTRSDRSHAQVLLLLCAAVLCWGYGKAFGAQYIIAMTSSNTFNPSYLVVHVGDAVTWTNEDDSSYHDSSSLGGFWWTGYLDYTESYSIIPSFTGTFPYEDSTWGPTGMTGVLVVGPPLPPPTVLMAPAMFPNGAFQCIISNLALGKTNYVQASTDFAAWTNVATNVATDYSFPFVDINAAAFSRRFYRVVSLP